MTQSKTIEFVKSKVQTVLESADIAHDFSHIERVLKNACAIAEHYPDANIYIVKLAALLHDVDDCKLGLSDGENENAISIMTACAIEPQTQTTVCEIINSVSFSHGKKADTLEAKIVQDADRLDAIGAIGIARTFAYGGRHNMPIYQNGNNCTVKHFYDKLLKLTDLLNLPASKNMAAERQKIMTDFLSHLENELSVSFKF